MKEKRVERSFSHLTPAEKLDLVIQLRQAAWELKASWFRKKNPAWSDERIQEAVRQVFLFSRN